MESTTTSISNSTTTAENNTSDVSSVLSTVHISVERIKKSLQILSDNDLYSNLSTEDKVQHDIFMSFALTSLFWIYVRLTGGKPTEHSVAGEIERLKQYMNRAKLIKERKRMPHIDKDAAKRFIRSGLWDINEERGTKRKRFDD